MIEEEKFSNLEEIGIYLTKEVGEPVSVGSIFKLVQDYFPRSVFERTLRQPKELDKLRIDIETILDSNFNKRVALYEN